MSATEPLTHVRVHGRHLFIPRSLTDPTFRHVDCDGSGEVPFMTDAMLNDVGDTDADPPTAEERRVLHELLTAVVFSATCRCSGTSASLSDRTDLEDDSDGVTSRSSRRSVSAPTAEETEEAPLPSCATSPSSQTKTALPKTSSISVPSCTCANAQTVACAVGVILLSCVLLRTTCE